MLTTRKSMRTLRGVCKAEILASHAGLFASRFVCLRLSTKDKSINIEEAITPEIIDMMNGARKKYFYFRHRHGGIELIKEATRQEWNA